MPKVAMVNMQGQNVGEIELSDNTFGAEIHEAAMHLVVRQQLNAMRQGTQSARTRTEVRGGGRQDLPAEGHRQRPAPWPQGSPVHPRRRGVRPQAPGLQLLHSPQGAASGHEERPEQQGSRRGHHRAGQAGAQRGQDPGIIAQMLKALGAPRKALLVIPGRDENVVRACGNIENLKATYVGTLNVVDILKYDKFIVTQEAARLVEEVYD